PQRVADIGCGCGVYAHAFRRGGVEVFALDGTTPPLEHSFEIPVHVQDLTVPFENIWGRFDFALCLEVAEHIPEALSDAFLENLARFSGTIIMSAAAPFQGGHHHVNEQPKRYWVRRLAERGYAYNRARTGRIVEKVRIAPIPLMWMVQHLSVYEKSASPAKPGHMLPFSVRPPR
ncbi:MAG: class I SAM-dependent methyltransferase, partial [Elusimicrobiota bacterium]